MNLNDAEQLKRMVVDPMVDSIKAEIGPLVARVAAIEARTSKLENIAGKAVKVYSGIIALGTFILHVAITKVRNKLGV
jgi:hypothetical protein